MKDVRSSHCVIAVALISLVLSAPNFAFSKTGTLTVQVDKHSYNLEELITISGMVPAVLEGEVVLLRIFNPKNTMYTIDQVTPNEDRMYSTAIRVGGKTGIPGTYTVKATYMEEIAEAKFEVTSVIDKCTSSQIIGVASRTICVNVEEDLVDYKLSNGIVKNIEIDPDSLRIIVAVNTIAEDGELTITLTRKLIDARFEGCKGNDDDFIVLVDGNEQTPNETDVTPAKRTLVIAVASGTEEVEIIGTCIVPEFSILALLVLSASTGAVIKLGRKSQIRKLQR